MISEIAITAKNEIIAIKVSPGVGHSYCDVFADRNAKLMPEAIETYLRSGRETITVRRGALEPDVVDN